MHHKTLAENKQYSKARRPVAATEQATEKEPGRAVKASPKQGISQWSLTLKVKAQYSASLLSGAVRALTQTNPGLPLLMLSYESSKRKSDWRWHITNFVPSSSQISILLRPTDLSLSIPPRIVTCITLHTSPLCLRHLIRTLPLQTCDKFPSTISKWGRNYTSAKTN